MANGITFDTHKFVTDMTAAKMPIAQAERLAKTYSELLGEKIVTKEHLNSIVKQLRSEIQAMESRLTTKFLFMLIGLYFSVVGTTVGIILTVLRLWLPAP